MPAAAVAAGILSPPRRGLAFGHGLLMPTSPSCTSTPWRSGRRWLESAPDPAGVRLRLRKTASDQARDHVRRGTRRRTVLRVDRRAEAVSRRRLLPAGVHAATQPRSIWSKVNIGHVARLIEEGRMRPAGQHEIDRAKADGRWDAAYRQSDGELPAEIQDGLDADPQSHSALAAQSAQNRFAMAFRVGDLEATGVSRRPRRRTTSKCSSAARRALTCVGGLTVAARTGLPGARQSHRKESPLARPTLPVVIFPLYSSSHGSCFAVAPTDM